ncbi:hypothetical protein HMPREF3206_01473 [Fusobacterium equinum]|nr:hypothetical protein HMPREF3206_01473 [Fusobacterium equinum]
MEVEWMKEKQIEKNEKYLIEEMKKHDGWCEVKIKHGYIIEANKKVPIKIIEKLNK